MKKVLIFFSIVLFMTGCASKEPVKKELTKTDEIVPTMLDEISDNSIWIGTFQLVWNDLKNEVVKTDIQIDHDFARNLNKETFTELDISPEYYYKKYGKASLKLKQEIEEGINKKFKQTSEILDDLDWDADYIFYTMLYREFEFDKKFEVLKDSNFGSKENVKYFGLKENANESLREQVEILFYDDDENFAIKLLTKNGDEVVLYRNPEGKTFEEIYNNLLIKTDSFVGNRFFQKNDELKVPMLSFNYMKKYIELEDKEFADANGVVGKITAALQTVEFILNEKGGKVKSEAGISYTKAIAPMPAEPRKLFLDDTFAMFLKEENKEKPYLAAKISDITKFQ